VHGRACHQGDVGALVVLQLFYASPLFRLCLTYPTESVVTWAAGGCGTLAVPENEGKPSINSWKRSTTASAISSLD
jgi:hypothetical protein